MARVEYLAAFASGYQALRDHGIEATTIETHARYRVPARFADTLVVHARCLDVRGARFRFEYAVERDGELVADGWSAHACIDAVTLRPVRVPDWLVDSIARAESARASA